MAFSEPDSLKVAVTAAAVAPTFTVQAAVPEQAPDHPAKLEFAAGVALSVTDVPAAKVPLQVWPQLIPAGLLVTVPVPGPTADTVTVPGAEKAAPTAVSAFNTTVHFPTPEQAPLHPENESPAAGVAVSVTEEPAAKLALQVVPQLMPAGVLLTVPDRLDDTVRLKSVGLGAVS
jgi:phage tail protein X